MKNGKAPCSSETVREMVKASPETSSEVITLLKNAIIIERTITLEWNNKYTINISKVKPSTSTVDLKKVFHRVPRKIMLWVMRVIDIPDLITLVKVNYDNVKSRNKVDCECNNVF